MSPGCATRLTCADGTRAFVKAVGAELNPDTPVLFRREVAVLDHLGEHELWARLLASYDDGAWVALLIEDVDGRHPDFADDAELEAVLTGVDRLSDGRCSERGVPDSVDLIDVAVRLPASGRRPSRRSPMPRPRRRCPGGCAPTPTAGPTSCASMRRGRCRTSRTGTSGSTTSCAAPTDGSSSSTGAWPRADPPGSTRCSLGSSGSRTPWFDASIASSPALAAAGDEVVTAFLAGFGAHLAVRSVVAVDVNLPTLNDFRITESRRMLAGVARRTGR